MPEEIRRLGGGFYEQVFLVTLPENRQVVTKQYRFTGLAAKETRQLSVLAAHSLLRIPRVFGVVEAGQAHGEYDMLLMEYLEGVGAGDQDVSDIPDEARLRYF